MPNYSNQIRIDRGEVINAACNAGSGPAKLRLYDGTKPATGGSVTSQTLLAELTMTDPAFTVTATTLTAGTPAQDSSANASGTPTWARIVDSDNNFVSDFTAGVGSGEVQCSAAIVSGQPVSISSFVVTNGNQ